MAHPKRNAAPLKKSSAAAKKTAPPSAPRKSARPSAPEKTRSAAGVSEPAASQFYTKDGGPWGKCFLPRRPGERRFWLVKSEPETFSWSDLWGLPDRTTHWDGVRNHAARNFLRDGMHVGDHVFFYHSSAEPAAIVGICEVAHQAYPDPTAFDPAHPGFDPDSSPAKPTWYVVNLRALEPLPRPVTLAMIKRTKALEQMALLRIGRLSVSPVTPAEWKTILKLAHE